MIIEEDIQENWDIHAKEQALQLKHDIDHMKAWKRKRDTQKQLRIIENRKPISSYFDDEWPNLDGTA